MVFSRKGCKGDGEGVCVCLGEGGLRYKMYDATIQCYKYLYISMIYKGMLLCYPLSVQINTKDYSVTFLYDLGE